MSDHIPRAYEEPWEYWLQCRLSSNLKAKVDLELGIGHLFPKNIKKQDINLIIQKIKLYLWRASLITFENQ